MATVAELHETGVSLSVEDREKVREQMNRLLETSHFRNSRRYPALLRFIVEETLEGRGEFLKERLLGVRVFDRPADYDTATDPIVRVTIAEIRKRIAQYYHDEAHNSELRIELLPGHYAPEFRERKEAPAQVAAVPAAAESIPALEPASSLEPSAKAHAVVTSPASRRDARRWSRRWLYRGLAGVLLLAIAGTLWIRATHASPLEQLWAPVLASPRPVLFCLPTGAGNKKPQAVSPNDSPADVALSGGKTTPAPGPTLLDHLYLGENVVFSDVLATLKIAGLLSAHQHEYRAKLHVSTSLDDLRQGPAVLIGGMDNPWTMRATASMRYHFAGSDEEGYWIEDASNPTNKQWSLDLKAPYLSIKRDYALIARVHNEQTGQIEVVVAGIGMSGTAAAGEFLVDPLKLEELRREVGPGFKNHDFEAVLSTDVVNGIAGSPKVIAVSVW